MNPWFAKAVVLLASMVMVGIRAPHGHRSRSVRVAKSRKGRREVILLTVVWIGFFVPIIWIASPVFSFADYPLYPIPLIAGSLMLALGLWLFHRSHADLGTNWSITLEVRESHRLVTEGIYRRIRHPMYMALLLYSLGQAIVLPNWVAGPSYLVAMTLLIALRLGPEEQIMKEEFGAEYDAYMSRTKRILPGVW
jgi:protein-S-isoprenylcysteine O-methyltransferase Ste14